MDAQELQGFWDRKVTHFLAGRDYMDRRLRSWHNSYRGRGRGEVNLKALPEPYLGSLKPEVARGVVLGLNPGEAYLDFQARNGIFASQIRDLGSYSAWAATWPYLRNPWLAATGRDRYQKTRHKFLERWLNAGAMPDSAMLTMELYPWHSTRKTAAMRPDLGIVREFVVEPLLSLGLTVGFAFGADWFPIIEDLGPRVIDRLGAGGRDYGSHVASRAVIVAQFDGDFTLVAEKHAGSAGPPSEPETHLLFDQLDGLRFAP